MYSHNQWLLEFYRRLLSVKGVYLICFFTVYLNLIAAQRIAYDISTSNDILKPLGNTIPKSSKLVRLGKARSYDCASPLKITFDNKETASHVLAQYNSTKRSGTTYLDGFRMVCNKTLLQRKILRVCHAELEQRTKNGENGLRIIFENGSPKIGSYLAKNGGPCLIPPSSQL